MSFFHNIVVVLIVGLSVRVTTDGVGQGLVWSRDEDGNRTARQIQCVENQEYLHGSFCCQNCKAGTYVKKACTRASEAGTCVPCEAGTFTEHPNGMTSCLPCSSCRHEDQEVTMSCNSTRDTQCQCRKGYYCEPDQPCEMCKRCPKCKEDEEMEKQCTPTSKTICRKKSTPSPSPTDTPESSSVVTTVLATVLPIIFVPVLLLSGLLLWKKWQSKKMADAQSDPNEVKIDKLGNGSSGPPQGAQESQHSGTEEPQQESQPLLQETAAKPLPMEDEDKGLGDSLPNTTNSSQTSLSALPTVPSRGSSPRHSPETQRQTPCRGEFQHRRLIPLNGEDSLKKSFDLFHEFLDIKIHNRFFRSIGLTDNMIKTAESTHPDDKVYELLKTWMQREGLKADINYLIEELLNLDQKLSAENISCKAVAKRYYKYEDKYEL
ncbi:tumor necrosis factor receptor superfamily member 5-like [Megalops cyprinoides]|uniref:tumor necrosis factor receptor superfamily member 5-like n=1 Tax=Megalops cyprinoides TaxID=118141 RepID=UPI00186425A4|nr:tumor necrosis factor receptor superfamily member 5-like [Megalops cyprinoides]